MEEDNSKVTSSTCPHCGAKVREWWHVLSPGLIGALIKFSEAVKTKGVNRVHLQKEVSLTKNEYNNFQKLSYFGLVAKYVEGENHKSGYWVLTRRGLDFIKNSADVPKKVKTFRDRLVDRSPETVRISDYFNAYDPNYWQKKFDFDISQGSLI